MGTPWAIVLCGSCCAITAVLFYIFWFGEIESEEEAEIRNAGLVAQRTGVSHIPDYGNRH